MINTHAKGVRFVRKRRKFWESQGYLVYACPMTRGVKDMFGLFDLLAVSSKHPDMYFEQVKSYLLYGKKKAACIQRLQNFKLKYLNTACVVSLAMWDKKEREWVVYGY